jgi:hypothetical protein
MRLKRSCLCGDRSLPRRRPPCVSSTVFGAGSLAGTGNFVSLSHPGRDRAPPTTPVEIDGATQVWHLSAHCAQFRAPAFPSSVPCRSRCRAPAGLARARTSHDIRPRALGTPPPKSFAPTPLHPSNDATGIRCGQHGFAPGMHFRADSGLCATANIAGAAARTRKENQCVMNYEQSTSISGKHHPENHKGEWSAPVVRQRARV